MPKYEVSAMFTGTKFLGVFEAETEEAAISKALDSDQNHASLCHQCASEVELDDTCAHEGVASLVDDDNVVN